MNATGLILSELVRLGCTFVPGQPDKLIDLELMAINDGVSRARAAARYEVRVSLSWLPVLGAVSMVDARGYVVPLSFEAVGKWLAKSLSGARCVVSISIDDASKLPARWTPSRIASQVAKVDALDAAAIRADAAAKRATAETWTPGDRRAAVLAASLRMEDCAYLVDVLAGSVALDGFALPPGPAVVTVGTALRSSAYLVAVPVVESLAGVAGWWFAPVNIAAVDDAAALAWFEASGAGVVAAFCADLGALPAESAGVLFRADGVPLRVYTVPGGMVEPGGLEPVTCFYSFGLGDGGALASGDRFADGAASAGPVANAWVCANALWGATVGFEVFGAVGASSVDVELSGDAPLVAVGVL